MSSPDLPPKNSSDIRLAVGTEKEVLAQTIANSEEWRGALSLDAYLRREEHLLQQELTRDGRLTPWMLVYQAPDDGDDQRQVLCGCETIKKKALVAKDGQVEDVVAHGVASVFCPPKYRGRGYAGRMLSELGPYLKNWQSDHGKNNAFSVLYSDIGKDFYAARGWQPFPSAHIALTAAQSVDMDVTFVGNVGSNDLAPLCAADEKTLRARLAQKKGTAVALIPDHATVSWHHAREDFVSAGVSGGDSTRDPQINDARGAIVHDVGGTAGKRVWCYWTRVWANPQEEAPNTLHILRLAVEDDAVADFEPASEEGAAKVTGSPVVHAVAGLLAVAQLRAHASGMEQVQIWNPTSTTLAAARLLDPSHGVVHREKESITSLQWYGEGAWQDVEWVYNEKYGWC